MNEIAKVKKEVKLAQWAEMVRQQNESAFGTIYVSFWNSSDSWQIEAEMTDTADIEEEESLDMGGISM